MGVTEEQKFFPKAEVELLMLFEKQFQGLLWLRLCASTPGGTDLIPGWGLRKDFPPLQRILAGDGTGQEARESVKMVRTSQAEIGREKFFLKRRGHSRAASGVFYFLTTGRSPSTTNQMKQVCCWGRLIDPPTVKNPPFCNVLYLSGLLHSV